MAVERVLLRADAELPIEAAKIARDVGALDTNIASIVARQGAIVVFVFAQNDWSPDDADVVVRMATELFQDLRVSTGR